MNYGLPKKVNFQCQKSTEFFQNRLRLRPNTYISQQIRGPKPKPINEKLRLRPINRLIGRPLECRLLELANYNNSCYWIWKQECLPRKYFNPLKVVKIKEIDGLERDKKKLFLEMFMYLINVVCCKINHNLILWHGYFWNCATEFYMQYT